MDFIDWVKEIDTYIAHKHPELLHVFRIYSGEALFARKLIDINLAKLPHNAKILEVGAGMFLLSCWLHREGYNIHALEPIGNGFGHFEQLSEIVLQHAGDYVPPIIRSKAEELRISAEFDFAFSLNVMEHVSDISLVIQNVVRSLKPSGYYRFICPNYAFPYESHFNIPTLINKPITYKIFRSRILRPNQFFDADGMWDSINWITISRIKQACNSNLNCDFSRAAFLQYLERISDEKFLKRKGWLGKIINILGTSKLQKIFALFPLYFLPIIDCRTHKNQNHL